MVCGIFDPSSESEMSDVSQVSQISQIGPLAQSTARHLFHGSDQIGALRIPETKVELENLIKKKRR